MQKLLVSLGFVGLLTLLVTQPMFAYSSYHSRSQPRVGASLSSVNMDGVEGYNSLGVRFQAKNILINGQFGTTEADPGTDEYDWLDGSVNFAPNMPLGRQVEFVPYAGLGYTNFDNATSNTGSESALGVNAGLEFRLVVPGRFQAPQVYVGANSRLQSSTALEVNGETPNDINRVYAGITMGF